MRHQINLVGTLFFTQSLIEVPKEELKSVAAHYINKFNPKYNISAPKNDRYHSLNKIQDKLGVNLNVLKLYMNHENIKMGFKTYDTEQFELLKQFIKWMTKNHPKIDPMKYSVTHLRDYLNIRTGNPVIPF